MKKQIVLLLSLIMVFLLMGCGKTESPSDVTDKFFKAIKEQDSETINELYEGDDLDLSDVEGAFADDDSGLSKEVRDKFVDMIFDFDYEVGDEEIKDDEATVKVKVTTYNLGEVISNVYTDLMSWAVENMFSAPSEEETEAKATEIFTEALDKSEKNYTGDIDLKLVKKDDKWMVSKDNTADVLLNALTGDLGKKIEELGNAFDE